MLSTTPSFRSGSRRSSAARRSFSSKSLSSETKASCLSRSRSRRFASRPAVPAAPVDVLSDREREVLALVAEGLPNAEIAVELGVAVNTVRNHVRSILEKLGLRNRVQAAVYAVRAGLLPAQEADG